MQTLLTQVNPCADPDWDQRVSALPGAGFFHSSAWAGTLMDAYGYRPIYALTREDERIVALIPMFLVDNALTGRRAVGLPFSDFCEPLASSDSLFFRLWRQLLDQGTEAGWKYIELRGGAGYFGGCAPFQVFDRHRLNLTKPLKELHLQLRQSLRQDLRRAARQQVVVERSADLEALREFYRLNCLTRKRHGLPPQPWRFFRSLHRHVLSRGLGQVFLARYLGEAIAGAVYLHFAKQAVYKYSASDYRHRSKRGNDAVMWQAICFFSENGFHSLDFGRTGRDNIGLRRYKLAWGAVPSSLAYYRYRLDQARYLEGDAGEFHPYNRVLSKLPLSVLRIMGELLYRYMG
ncbi:MAG: hypothetical protein AUK55_14350 [Syntrophobacteraceae bacterium CG2_30_61_12]|nr:MAG: hypothetical protein AUK55_14350 [Syntrophobacteraceae bacterium CG2_30_61_12]PIU31967.1 MAG: hypothetical protein COT06_05265 [Syntrophobacteraceae bacterium CG07_land_8_20_14_0_80_61_8]